MKELEKKCFDVAITGGGTGGVIAALASARQGAKTVLIESKGYVGGLVVEGGTALHSFYNNWKTFGKPKKQIVKGIPQELMDRLIKEGACPGHIDVEKGYEYDSACTIVDVEQYKLIAHQMLVDEGVQVYVDTMLIDAHTENGLVKNITVHSHGGSFAIEAKSFVDCTGYGDLCAYAGAEYTEPNDYDVVNSAGVAGVNVEKYCDFLFSSIAGKEVVRAKRDGKENQIIRVDAYWNRQLEKQTYPKNFTDTIQAIGMSTVITTTHDNYFMFLKFNYRMPEKQTNSQALSDAELELRRRQKTGIELLRQFIPGCENAFIARSSPAICIRRARCITCEYDLTNKEVISGKHFEDDVFTYGFHDFAPRFNVNEGGTYGTPYRALLPKGLLNVYATGMMITTDRDAHMSTRNTVSCMGHGQAAGTAAALCAKQGILSRELDYKTLRLTLLKDNVYLE